jgi:hypothetical protein
MNCKISCKFSFLAQTFLARNKFDTKNKQNNFKSQSYTQELELAVIKVVFVDFAHKVRRGSDIYGDRAAAKSVKHSSSLNQY